MNLTRYKSLNYIVSNFQVAFLLFLKIMYYPGNRTLGFEFGTTNSVKTMEELLRLFKILNVDKFLIKEIDSILTDFYESKDDYPTLMLMADKYNLPSLKKKFIQLIHSDPEEHPKLMSCLDKLEKQTLLEIIKTSQGAKSILKYFSKQFQEELDNTTDFSDNQLKNIMKCAEKAGSLLLNDIEDGTINEESDDDESDEEKD